MLCFCLGRINVSLMFVSEHIILVKFIISNIRFQICNHITRISIICFHKILHYRILSDYRTKKTKIRNKNYRISSLSLAVADPEIPKRGCGRGGLGTEIPQRGPGAEPRGPPEATDIMLHSQLTASENFNTKTYTTRQKQDKLSARN